MSVTYQPVSVNQATTEGTNYPFVRQPQDRTRFLLGDLWLAYDDDDYVLPLKMDTMTGFGGSTHPSLHAQDLLIIDAEGRTVFDTNRSDVTFTVRPWTASLKVLEWTDGDTILRCTWHLVAPAWAPASTALANMPDLDLDLDPRTYTRLPKRVKSLRVGLTKLKGNLIFIGGYNIDLKTEIPTPTPGGRFTRRVLINATPGGGLGRAPGCDDSDSVIRKIRGVGPNPGGDFSLDAPGCYRAQRPTHVTSLSPRTVAPGLPGGDPDSYLPIPSLPYALNSQALASALQLSNDCKPCCTCEDYVNTDRGVSRIEQSYRSYAARAQTAAGQLKTAIDRWEAQRQCRLIQPLKLVVQGESGCGLYVAGLHCNMTRGCTSTLILRITIQAFRSGTPVALTGVQIRCPETYRTGTDTRGAEVRTVPGGAWPVYDFYFDTADPQATSRFRTRIKLNGCTDNDTVRVTLSIHVAQSVDPSTGHHYTLADPTDIIVPSDVLAIWATHAQPAPIRAFLQTTRPVGPTYGCGDCQ